MLFHFLKVYKLSVTQSVTISVVGFLNVGKRSLINTLIHAKVHHHVRFELGMFIMA